MRLRENGSPWASWPVFTLAGERSLEPASFHNSWPGTSVGPFWLLDTAFSLSGGCGFFFQFKVHQMMKKQCQSPDPSALIAWACTYVLRLCMWVCSSRGGCEDVLMWRFVELTARRVSQTEGPWTILCCAYPYCFSGADPSEKSWRRQKEAIHIVQVIRSLMSCYKIGRKPNYHYKRIKVGNKVTEVFMFCLVSAP